MFWLERFTSELARQRMQAPLLAVGRFVSFLFRSSAQSLLPSVDDIFSIHPPTYAFSCQSPMCERRIRCASLHSGGRFRKQQSTALDDLEKNFLVFCACSSSVLNWCLGWHSLSNVFLSFTATSTRDARSTCNCEHGWSGKEFPGLLRSLLYVDLVSRMALTVDRFTFFLLSAILKSHGQVYANTPALSGLAS